MGLEKRGKSKKVFLSLRLKVKDHHRSAGVLQNAERFDEILAIFLEF
jgi:hypothetical protein